MENDTKQTERLKVIRKFLKLSQFEFSSSPGLKQGSYSDIERGKTNTLSKSVVEILEYRYSINKKWLLTGDGEMLKSEVNNTQTRHEVDYKEKYYDILEELLDVRRELDDLKNEKLRLKDGFPNAMDNAKVAQ